jgi:hypothetical protein
VTYKFSGHGTQSTDLFHLNKGSAKFTFTITPDPGFQYFGAYLYRSDGTIIDIIANTNTETTVINRAAIPTTDDYYIKTNTQDGWEVAISQ